MPTCARIRPCRRPWPAPHRVVVLAIAPVIGYDLTIPPQVLGEAFDDDGHPLYDVAGREHRRGSGGRDPGLHHRPVGRPGGARRGPDGHRARHPDRRSAARRHAPRRPACGAGHCARRRPVGVDLHRRVRPGRGRDPRRAPSHDPLEVRRRLPSPLSRGRARRGRALHRRRPGADVGRAERRHRPVPAPRPQRPRHRRRQRGRPPHGGPAVARRRAGAVHRATAFRRAPTRRPATYAPGRRPTSTVRSTSPPWPAAPR